MTATERLDRATRAYRLLDHSFYKAWADGTLTREDLAFYSKQYWRQVEAFPGYLDSLAERLPEGKARKIVLENLADERDDDHPGLWLDFAEALGIGREEVRASEPENETEQCVDAFRDATRTLDPAFALGMLYGYESQSPDVAATKVTGLRDFYGIDGPGVAYFELHGELDVEHARELGEAIEEVATDEDIMARAEAGARAGAHAIWSLLDGVARVRGIG